MSQRYPFQTMTLGFGLSSLSPYCDPDTLYLHHGQYYAQKVRELNGLVSKHRLTNLTLEELLTQDINMPVAQLARLKGAILPPGLEEFNLHAAQGKECSVDWIEQAVDCLPMMAERTLVLVTDYDLFKAGERDREEYIRILSNLPDYCCLVFLYDLIGYKPDARTKLAQAVKQHGTVVEFARQGQRELTDWVRRHFKAQGKDIDPRLCEELIFLCGDLMHSLQQEIGKIAAFCQRGQNYPDRY